MSENHREPGTALERPAANGCHGAHEPWSAAGARQCLDEAGVAYLHESGTSLYFRDLDGARVELIADPLGERYGQRVA